MEPKDYWQECISEAAEECELKLTIEQLECFASSAEAGHDHYGMAFYSPPESDRMDEIEREWKKKYTDLKAEFEAYQGDAETAVKRAMRQFDDSSVSIGKYGEVLRHGGRTERIQ